MQSQAQIPFDLMSADVQQCPFGAYDWLVENAPVYSDSRTGMVILSGYEMMREILKDPETYSNEIDWRELREGGIPPESTAFIEQEGFHEHPTLSRLDDPLHRQKRSMVDRVFAASKIKMMEMEIIDIANRLVDDFEMDGHCEFVRDFAVPLPCIVIARQIGVPDTDIHLFKHWSDAIMSRIGNMLSDEDDLAATRVTVESQQYLKRIIDDRRETPCDDIISGLIHEPLDDGRMLDDAEIIALLTEILVGGNETTTSAIASGMRILIETPGLWQTLAQDQAAMRNFIEETLRLETPIQGLYRITTREVELGGSTLPQGTVINVRWAAANRDPAKFECPGKLDLQRRNAGAHMTFGSGIHHCLGAPLARLEMRIAFETMIRRFTSVRYQDGFGGVKYLPSFLQRSICELPIEFERA